MNTYTIWLDGKAYGGEDDVVENSAPTQTGVWYDRQPATVSGVVIGGEPYVISGRRGLRSHMERILNRIDRLNPTRIVIQREPDTLTPVDELAAEAQRLGLYDRAAHPSTPTDAARAAGEPT